MLSRSKWVLGLLMGVAATLVGCGGGQTTTTAGPVISDTHPKVLVNNASTLTRLQQLMSTQASSATRFKAYVDNEMANPGQTYGFETWHAALMFQVSGATRYADFAVAQTDSIVAGEEARIASGQAAGVAGDSYLYVGGTVGNIALVYDWCYSRLTPAQRTRWIAYMNQAVSNVWNPAGASWGGRSYPWSGWSVDNPSNNYYYSFLRATMLLGLATHGDNPLAQRWVDQFRTTKIANELVPTFTRDLAGGGSREGTGYGTAMKELFQLYYLWERSTGERIATLTPHAQASQAWMLHNIVPSLDRLAAVGDQARESSASLFDYHREYLMSLTALFPDQRLSAATRQVLADSTVPQIHYGFELFSDYLYEPAGQATPQLSNLSTAYWGSGTGQLLMRSSWQDKTAAFAQFSCGPLTESHAHRDQGAFQLYRGEWLAPTTNIYTHSGIQQGEEFNNLVRIEQAGHTVTQVGGPGACQLLALAHNDTYTYGVARVTPAYNGNAAVTQVEREFLFIKPGVFVVFDRVGSVAGTRRIWTLNLPGTPAVSGDHLAYTASGGNKLDVYRLAPAGLSYQVNTLVLPDGDTLLDPAPRRVEVADTAGTQSTFLHVLGTNAAVTSVARSDAAGQTGVQIVLTDGRTVIARFANTSTGGTLEVRSSTGVAQVSGALPTTVVAPPLFKN